eukprot:3203796-Pyramimonas_sp.AAC.1
MVKGTSSVRRGLTAAPEKDEHNDHVQEQNEPINLKKLLPNVTMNRQKTGYQPKARPRDPEAVPSG